MHPEHHRFKMAICWLAIIFISGEFAWALADFVREGRALAIYMAVDAVLRETRSGARYQEMIMDAAHRVMMWCRSVKPLGGRPTPIGETPKPNTLTEPS